METSKLVSIPKKKKNRFTKSKTKGFTQRPSTVSVVSLSEVTEESLEVWRGLPEEIRHDPLMASFRKKEEKINPQVQTERQDSTNDYDPLDTNFSDDEDPKDIELVVMDDGKIRPRDFDEKPQNETSSGHKKPNLCIKIIKITILLSVWLAFTFYLTSQNEKEIHPKQLSISEGKIKTFVINEKPLFSRIKLIFEGSLLRDHYDEINDDYIYFYLTIDDDNGTSRNISKLYKLPITNSSIMDTSKELKRTKTIYFNDDDYEIINSTDSNMKVNIYTHLDTSFPINFSFDPSPLDKSIGILFAAGILIGLYVLIIWELVHRTFAAMIASTLALGVLAAMNERPTMHVIISWIDVETLLLLFGMMILVAVLSETGVFDYLAVYAFKITNGKIWPLIICLCLFTGIVSSVLDNVTTILLMTPVTIRLCEVMELNPVTILIFNVIFSNIGGTMTPVGDPPNVIIASNSYITKSGINFTNFTMHMSACIFFATIVAFFQIKWMFKTVNDLRFDEPSDVQKLRHEISIWHRSATSLSPYSKDEEIVRKSLMKKVERLQVQLEKKLKSGEVATESYIATLEELEKKYPIKNKMLLFKSCIALIFVITFFFLHSVPNLQKLSLGWTALLGAVLLLILYDREDMEAILHHVEWATLLFFAALFVLMEALAELGLIEWIGKQTVSMILSVGEGARLAVAILIILWVSALASAFVDNIPLTTMMIKIVISLAENEALNLPLQPLVWSLALGACLGGNGTLIGASANVVCAGVAEQHGYKFSFNNFFKIGFPVMIGNIIVATIYLMLSHVIFTWH